MFHYDDWMKMLHGKGSPADVDAVTDYPACFFWKEIHEAFPDAKVFVNFLKIYCACGNYELKKRHHKIIFYLHLFMHITCKSSTLRVSNHTNVQHSFHGPADKSFVRLGHHNGKTAWPRWEISVTCLFQGPQRRIISSGIESKASNFQSFNLSTFNH